MHGALLASSQSQSQSRPSRRISRRTRCSAISGTRATTWICETVSNVTRGASCRPRSATSPASGRSSRCSSSIRPECHPRRYAGFVPAMNLAGYHGLRDMTTFVLVPGAGGAGAYWHRVVELLEAGGHTAAAVDLPGADPKVGIVEYAELVLAAAGGRDDVVLVAQSM